MFFFFCGVVGRVIVLRHIHQAGSVISCYFCSLELKFSLQLVMDFLMVLLTMTESAVALGVVGIDRLGGGLGGGAVPNFRFAGPFWPKNGPLWAARKRRKHRKYQQKWP